MSLALLVLWVALGAVAATIGVTVGVRAAAAIARRRLLRHGRTVRAHLTAYVAEARDDAPPAPRSRFARRAMRRDLVALPPSVKGGSRARLTALFAAYGLPELARRDLDSRDALTRVRAAEALGTMAVADAVPWLRARLAHADGLTRLACARALGELGAVDALPAVVAALAEGGAQPGEVAEVVLGFGAPAVPFLRERLRCGGEAERRLAAAALGEMRAHAAAGELRAALDADDDELAARAARGLGRLGDAAHTPALTEVLWSDRAWFVRVAAAHAAGGLDDPTCAPALLHALADDDFDVRNAAAQGLAALGEAGLRAVAGALDDLPDRAVAHYAGVLDVADRLPALVRRAAAGDEPLARLVHRAHAAGVTACLDALAAEGDAYATAVGIAA